jgi:hemolysin D
MSSNDTVVRHPFLQLLRRYREITADAWQHRHELAGPARLADEIAFLPAALSLQETPVHPAPRRAAYAIMLFFTAAIAWSVFGQVDIVAVASGRIIVNERSKLVQPLERSVVKRILVKDGDTVRAGQPLVELDATAPLADKTSAADQLHAAQSEFIRTTALLDALEGSRNVESASRDPIPLAAFPSTWSADAQRVALAQLHAEWADVSAKTGKLASERSRRQAEMETAAAAVAKLEATLPLARQREDDFSTLADQGFVASHAGQDRTRERIELENDLLLQRARLRETVAALRESQAARAAFVAETLRALHDRRTLADSRRVQATQEQNKATQRERLTVLAAPVSGTVQQLAVHTAGGVVTEAQTLMVVVPDEPEVTAEVAMENKDVGFVRAGQPAEIKLETFPFTRYGTVAASVKHVSADAVTDEKRGAFFPATLVLQTSQIDVDGRTVRLSPGMNLTAEIKTGQRRVVEFLLSPVVKAGRESLRER